MINSIFYLLFAVEHEDNMTYLNDKVHVTESYTETKTVVLWTPYYDRITLPDLTSWSHCPNDIKGSCVFTSNRSKYEVSVELMDVRLGTGMVGKP